MNTWSMWPPVLAFAIGAFGLQFFSVLPAVGPVALLFLVSLLLLRWRSGRVLVSLVAGLLWSLMVASQLLERRLPVELEGQDIEVVGVVASIPQRNGRRTRFILDVEQAPAWQPGARVRISWYRDAPVLKAGQRWRLTLRLKRPRGFANPGGFDYSGWLFRGRISATGYVRPSDGNELTDVAVAGYPVARWRQALADRLAARGDGDIGALMAALAVGDRGGMQREQWEVLSATGTNHLLAISGLHIGLMAGIGFFLGRWLWALPVVTLRRLPATQAGAVTAVVAAAMYALLAGLSLPTQRALVMVVVVMAAVLLRTRVLPARSLALALGVVLLLDPLAVLEPGFWLSFCAVGVLVFGMGWRPREQGLWWRAGRAQWIIVLGLLPLLMLLFQRVSLAAPVANIVAIPWVGFTVVPPLLAGSLTESLLPGSGAWMLDAAAWSLGWLWRLLEWAAAWPYAAWQVPGYPIWVLGAAGAGALLWLAPAGMPGRWLGVLGFLPMLGYQPPRPPDGEAWVTQLDVGHGLAVVVQTRKHTLLFDTGPAYGRAFDGGSAVILPFLRDAGVDRIDTLVVSHGDRDHVGGLDSVRRRLVVGEVLSGVPERVSGALRCHAGQQWRWDGVRFQMLHPLAGDDWRGNDGSCVLQVITGGGRLLVPGDIEVAGEDALVARSDSELASDVLVAPHHGSRTSSTEPFLAAVQPDIVLVPAGFRDRYGHPHAEVVERYREHGARVLGSAEQGALAVRLPARQPVPEPCSYRAGFRRYWHAVDDTEVGAGERRSWSACREQAR